MLFNPGRMSRRYQCAGIVPLRQRVKFNFAFAHRLFLGLAIINRIARAAHAKNWLVIVHVQCYSPNNNTRFMFSQSGIFYQYQPDIHFLNDGNAHFSMFKRPKSLSENSEGCCFRAKGWMASGADHRPRRGRIPFMGLRPRSNEASRLFARKPSGRRVFCLWAALARSSARRVGTTGKHIARRLAHSQNPSPQHPSQFSDRL